MSGYEGWMCTELRTECPDCNREITESSGDLAKFLDMLDEHEWTCPGPQEGEGSNDD